MSTRLQRLTLALQARRTALIWARQRRTEPPVVTDVPLGRFLWRAPMPLLHPGSRVMVIYSAKSACTNLHLWFYHHLGCLRAARDFHIWPHDYREYVYLYSALYREAYTLDFSKFTVIRVVRDPYERAVSGFRHMVMHAFAGEGLRNRLRFRNIATTGLSFAEFLDFLETIDLAHCDAHYRIQRHPIEDVLPVHHLINVSTDNLFTRLNEVEAAIGLPRSDIPAEPWFKELRFHQRPGPELPHNGALYRQRLTVEQAKNGPWPAYSALLTPEARERIARLYAVDIASYLQPPSRAHSAHPDGSSPLTG